MNELKREFEEAFQRYIFLPKIKLNYWTYRKLRSLKSKAVGYKDWAEYFDYLTRDIQLQPTIHERISEGTMRNLLNMWMLSYAENLHVIRYGLNAKLTYSEDYKQLTLADLAVISPLVEGIDTEDYDKSASPVIEYRGAKIKNPPLGSAIVIGRGPSLFRNKHCEMLAKSDYKGVIVASDGGLIPLLEAGVVPQFVVTVDGAPIIKKWFDHPLVKEHGHKIKWVVTVTVDSEVYKVAVANGVQPYWFQPLFDDWRQNESWTRLQVLMTRTEKYPMGVPRLQSGANCGACAWIFAMQVLKRSPVALIGLDLGYPIDMPISETHYYKNALELANGDVGFLERAYPKYHHPFWKNDSYVDLIFNHYRESFLELQRETQTWYRLYGGTINCIPEGTEVLSNPEIKTVEQCFVGTPILTHNGNYKKIVKVYKREYSGKIHHITCRNRMFLKLTAEHPVLVVKGKTPKSKVAYFKNRIKREKLSVLPKEWISANLIRKGDFVVHRIPTQIKDVAKIELVDKQKLETYRAVLKLKSEGKRIGEIQKMLKIPRYRLEGWFYRRWKLLELSRHGEKVCKPISLDCDFLRLIGYYLSEGCIGYFKKTMPANIIWVFGGSLKEREYVNDVTKILSHKFGLSSNITTINNATRVTVGCAPLARFLSQFGTSANIKHLPNWVMLLPSLKQSEIVKGYWRGDGSISKYGISFTSASKILLQQMRLLLMRNGILSSLYTSKNRKKAEIRGRKLPNQISYALYVYGWTMRKMANLLGISHPLLLRKAATLQTSFIDNNHAYFSVEKNNVEDFDGVLYNFAVKDDESYTVEGFGTLHNCTGGGTLFGDRITCMDFENFLKEHQQ